MNNEQTQDNTSEENKGTDNPQKSAEDYYSVDDPKKSISTTIGDGEMHNEGLVGDGSVSDDGTFSGGTTSEQDEAANHDSEG